MPEAPPPSSNGTIRSHAQACVAAGLCALPAVRDDEGKRVALAAWKVYQERLPTCEELRAWFGRRHSALCIVCGAVSGNLEMIDFDLGGEAFSAWRGAVEAACPGLAARVVIESTPSGGRHVVYRCSGPVSGNTKLASRRIEADGPDELVVGGKTHKPRQDSAGRWQVVVTLIETRGEG
ncbi:MAG: bifunctional DNA primase/polymerase, partial [Melioribacteraceae bacterium]|nr:bifunctional DNA primase/polymerase [Melioribacteraceae bacterium]